jgi:hypothetical protein
MRHLPERLVILELQDSMLIPTLEGMSDEEWRKYLKKDYRDIGTTLQRIHWQRVVGGKFKLLSDYI